VINYYLQRSGMRAIETYELCS